MEQRSGSDVLICGAGAAGLVLAIELARRGVSFRLVDKLPGPFRGSRGKGIQPRTLELLEDLGLVDRVIASGGPYPPEREYRADATARDAALFEACEPGPQEPYPIPWMVPQFVTEALLRERLVELGGRPEFACELVGFAQDDEGVSATVATGKGEETVRARFLVGSDGGRSFVRSALRIEFPGKTLGVRAVVADVIASGIGRDAWHRWNEGSMEKQISLCPLQGTELFQLQGPIPLDGEIDLSARGLSALLAERTGRADVRVEAVSWASAFTMNARLADRYRAGRVFLAGDAAHTHPPTGGQGLNTSVQDSYNLGWKLSAVLAGAPLALLDSYERERRPIAEHMLGLSTALLEAAKAGSMRRGREVHQLDLCYPDSPLSLEEPERRSGVLAGDRAPDAPLRGAGGRPTRLFELFKGTHWTLVGCGVDRLSGVEPRAGLHVHAVGPRGDLVDDGAHFRGGYGLGPGDWVLVRPDGYVGAIVSSARVRSLERVLDAVGLAAPQLAS